MASDQAILSVAGLTALDRAELSRALGGDVEFSQNSVGAEGVFGDPAVLAAVVTLSQTALIVLGAWLQKRRSRTDISMRVTTVDPDGHRQEVEFDLHGTASQAAPQEVVARLAHLANLTASQ